MYNIIKYKRLTVYRLTGIYFCCLLIIVAGCNTTNSDANSQNTFTATITGAIQDKLEGTAGFTPGTRPTILLQNTKGDLKEILISVALDSKTPIFKKGTFNIINNEDSSATAKLSNNHYAGIYKPCPKESECQPKEFHSVRGELTITQVYEDKISGTFHFTALPIKPDQSGLIKNAPSIKITGKFKAILTRSIN